MTARNPKRRRPRGRTAVLWTSAGGLALLCGLFFLLVNDSWVPVRVPRPPWGGGPALLDYEVRFAALVLVPLVFGAAVVALLGRRALAAERRRTEEQMERAAGLEADLDKISRLLSTSRNGDRISR